MPRAHEVFFQGIRPVVGVDGLVGREGLVRCFGRPDHDFASWDKIPLGKSAFCNADKEVALLFRSYGNAYTDNRR